MNAFLQFLYKSNLLAITDKHLERWWNQKEVDLLIIATEVGSSKNRLKALDKLRTLPSYSTKIKSHLIGMLRSQNLYVAEKSLEILKKNYMPRELEDDESFKEALHYMKSYKKYNDAMISYNAETTINPDPLRKSRSDMVRLRQAKKKISKGYRSGF